MATLEARIIALAQAVGGDVKTLRGSIGDLTSLTTTTKTNLVSAINELKALVDSNSGGTVIDDGAGNGATTVTWSADKIYDTIEAAKVAVKDSILDGAGAALDTLKELADALGNDANFAATIAADVANRVRYDQAQTLTAGQRTQARDNIGAASAASVTAITDALGNTDHDFAADYTTAAV